MIIKIVFVKKLKSGTFGTTQVIDNDNILIKVSTAKNKKRLEFFVTMFHELLHCWFIIMRANGLKLTPIKEHKVIYLAQNAIVEGLRKLL